MIDLTTELVKEQDKWHRRYNDAEIEIDRLKRENERLELAIHRLIMERDCAIKDVNDAMYSEGYMCHLCILKDCDGEEGCEPTWRGVKR